MSQIYGTRYRGTVQPYFVPKQSGVIHPDPRMPGDPCPCPGDFPSPGEDDGYPEIQVESIVFFNQAGAAGTYKASTNLILWPFALDGLWKTTQQWAGSNTSFNIFLTDTLYSGESGLPQENLLIKHSNARINGVPAAGDPIGPIIETGSAANDRPANLFPVSQFMKFPGGKDKRLGIVIRSDGAPGAFSFLSFALHIRRLDS